MEIYVVKQGDTLQGIATEFVSHAKTGDLHTIILHRHKNKF